MSDYIKFKLIKVGLFLLAAFIYGFIRRWRVLKSRQPHSAKAD